MSLDHHVEKYFKDFTLLYFIRAFPSQFLFILIFSVQRNKKKS